MPLDLLRELGGTLRRSDWKVTAVLCDDLLIAVEPGDTSSRRFALAFDLGTTTVVANLLDLETGQPAAVCSMLNKQQPFGADVITRISAVMMDPEALEHAARSWLTRRSPSWPRRSAARRASTPPRCTRSWSPAT